MNNDQTGSQAWRVDYTYDRWGNRYQAAGQGGVPVIDSAIEKTRNRFVTVGSTLMIYDAAGNLTIDQKFRGMQFTYDANGRMRRTDATNAYSTSVYNIAAQRVQTFDSLTNMTRQTAYDAFGRVIADYENGEWKRDYIYRGGNDELMSSVDVSGAARYVLTDHQGSARLVTNQAGQVTSRLDYRPFGEELGAGMGLRTTVQGYSSSDPPRSRYAMTERDLSTGLDHTWFRKFDSLSGKWTSPDPYLGRMSLSDPQSFNSYAYVKNDPVNINDRTGLYWQLSYCYSEVRISREGQLYFTGREHCVYTFVNAYSGSPFSPIEPRRVAPDQNRDAFCKRLLQRIYNVRDSIRKRLVEFVRNPRNLDFVKQGAPLSGDGIGHLKLIMDDHEHFQKLIQDCTDKCGGPPPGIPVSRSPREGEAPANGIDKDAAVNAVAATGAVVTLYFIVRTIGRVVFPVSNLVPVP